MRHVFVFPATSLGTLNAWERRTLVRLVYWEHWERHTSVWHVYWEHLGTPHFSVTWVVFYLESLKTSQLESWQPLKIKQGFAQRTRRTQRGGSSRGNQRDPAIRPMSFSKTYRAWERRTLVRHVYWERQLLSWHALKIKQGFAQRTQRTRRTQRGDSRWECRALPVKPNKKTGDVLPLFLEIYGVFMDKRFVGTDGPYFGARSMNRSVRVGNTTRTVLRYCCRKRGRSSPLPHPNAPPRYSTPSLGGSRS